ncbi:MAG: hypothetical protein FGM16_10470 [Flavobacterium sp.]|nr:hypothetical protein [Flavobacterium sp.]
MKKLLLLLFAGLIFTACSSDSNTPAGPTLSDTPTAKIQFNDTNFGIYKGIIVGPSGVITLNIKNDGFLNATVVLDGESYLFTSEGTVTEGLDITDLVFTNGDKSFAVSVSANGTNITETAISFPGYPSADMLLTKEYSDAQVTCYQGTYSGDATGVFNFLAIGDNVYGLSLGSDGLNNFYIQGSRSGNSLTGTYDLGIFSGTYTGNNVSGTWDDDTSGSSNSGTWSSQRKL